MKILHLYKAYAPVLGGIEGHVQALAEAQAAAGYHVTVLVTHPARRTAREHVRGVEVIRAAAPFTLSSTPLSLAYLHEHAHQAPDLTHVHSPYPPAELMAWRGPSPYVLSLHAQVTRPAQRAIMALYAPLWQQVLRGAARIVVASPQLAVSDWLCALRPEVVPYGIDPVRFAPVEVGRRKEKEGRRKKEEERRKEETEAAAGGGRLAGEGIVLLFVGRLRHYKGVDVLLHALTQVPRARLVVAGDGPEASRLKTLAMRMGLSGRIGFPGNIPPADLPSLYRQADVFVLPAISSAEAFGIVLLEAMASGLPCITTDPGTGTAYVVRHEETGLVVPPADPVALASALNRLAADPALRQQMGAAGRARVLAQFTRERMIRGIEAVYYEVSSSGCRPA